MEKVPITKQGMENLKAEWKTLLTVERPRIKKAIAEAREHGDLKENAEYHAAKEKQSFIEGRINAINGKMATLFIVEKAPANLESIQFGAKVTIENVDTEEIFSYQIVGPDESEVEKNRISFKSPLARALIGKRLGDVVSVDIPRGKIEVEITEVQYS